MSAIFVTPTLYAQSTAATTSSTSADLLGASSTNRLVNEPETSTSSEAVLTSAVVGVDSFVSAAENDGAACGSIIEVEMTPGGEEEFQTPIEDCDNPFNEDVVSDFPTEVQLNGLALTEGSIVALDLAGVHTFSLNATGNPFFQSIDLYKQVGEDYVLMEPDGFAQYLFEEATYSVVVLSENEPMLGHSRWIDTLALFFFPQAVAYYPNFTDVQVITFTVEAAPTEPVCEDVCASSILFLPGIQASRLYTETEKVWEPGNNNDVRQLAMNPQGESINRIYTEDVVDEIAVPVIGNNVYKDFLNVLSELTVEETIVDWDTYAYDWRYDVFDIARNGTEYATGTRYLDEVVANLAASSYTKKVTLVAHSNGGLLAKALLIEHPELADKIDSIIFIGTPHLGTPKAIATVLHGYDQQALGGLVIDDAVARDVIKNLPGAYSLLPSKKYIEQLDRPLITFSDGATTQLLRDSYGIAVTNTEEFTNFLNGSEGRIDDYSNISAPYTTNSTMLSNALLNQHTNFDSWAPPANIAVHNIVGTGVKTISALEYRDVVENSNCISNLGGQVTCDVETKLRPYAHFTVNGDETVAALSASAVEGQTHYINLLGVNAGFLGRIFNRGHVDLTETSQVQQLVKNIIASTSEDIIFVTSQRPTIEREFDVISIDSPVEIKVTAINGDVTGMVENELVREIEGSDYLEFADTKYLLVPDDIDYTVELFGQDFGGYTLRVASLNNDVQNLETELINATTTPTMTARFEKTGDSFSTISIDIDGDGAFELETDLNGKVIESEVPISYDDLHTAINNLDLKRSYKKPLLQVAGLAERFSQYKDVRPVYGLIEHILLMKIERYLAFYQRKGVISSEEKAAIKAILASLRDSI